MSYYKQARRNSTAEQHFSRHSKRLTADLEMMRVLGLDDYLKREAVDDAATVRRLVLVRATIGSTVERTTTPSGKDRM